MRSSVTDPLSRVFAALADPTRRAIVVDLSTGALSVNDLVERHHLSQPGISKHLKVLEAAGLVRRGRIRQTRPCNLDRGGIRAAAAWLEEFRREWEGSFERMDELLSGLGKPGDHDA